MRSAANIRVDARGAQVLRVLPRLNEEINEEWISDKTRYACDGLARQRLDRPYVRRDGKLHAGHGTRRWPPWPTKSTRSNPERKIAAIVGDQCDAEAMFALKQLMDGKGVANIDCRQDARKAGGARAGYVFNRRLHWGRGSGRVAS